MISPIDQEISTQGYFIEEIGFLDDGEIGLARNMEIFGTTLVVADGQNGVLLIDISNPNNMVQISQFIDFANEGEFARDVDVINSNRMIVYTDMGNFYSVDITDPTKPVKEFGFSWMGGGMFADVVKLQQSQNNAIFVLEQDYFLDRMYTFSSYNFTSPTYERVIYGEEGQFPEVTGLVVDGDFAYISDSTTISKYNISNNGLQLMNTLEGLEFAPFDIHSSSIHMIQTAEAKYIVSTTGMIIDITNEAPMLVNTIGFEVLNIRDIVMADPITMIVAGTDTINTYDISTIENIIQTDRIPIETQYYDINFHELNYISTDEGVLALNFVQDNLAPSISSPSDVSEDINNIIQGAIEWSVSDSNPSSYKIYRNGTLVQTGIYPSSGTVTLFYTNWGLGTYNVNLQLTDKAGNTASDSVIVSLYETIPPEIRYESGYEFTQGNPYNILNWTVFDNSSMTYDLSRNGTQIFSGQVPEENHIEYNISSYLTGYYQFDLNVYDEYGNGASSSITISVVEPTGPIINYLGEQSYSIDGTDFPKWEIISDTEVYYNIYINGEMVVANNFLLGNDISLSLDNLQIGLHNITIVATNNLGSTTNEVFIELFDNTAPTIVYTSEFVFQVDDDQRAVQWSVTDSSPMTYTLMVDLATLEYDQVVIDNNVYYAIDNHGIGTYEFSLSVVDSSGNSNNHSVTIEIVDDVEDDPTDSPISSTSPTDTTPTSEITPTLQLNYPVWMVFLPLLGGIIIRRRD